MRKFLVILGLALVSTLTVSAQSKQKVDKYAGYGSIGVNLSKGVYSYSTEWGVYNNKTWYGVGVSTNEDILSKRQWYGYFKAYYKVNKLTTHAIDFYGTGAVNVHLAQDREVTFEPGVATVFNVSKDLAPQFSLSFPIGETATGFRANTFNIGLGLNVWIR